MLEVTSGIWRESEETVWCSQRSVVVGREVYNMKERVVKMVCQDGPPICGSAGLRERR